MHPQGQGIHRWNSAHHESGKQPMTETQAAANHRAGTLHRYFDQVAPTEALPDRKG